MIRSALCLLTVVMLLCGCGRESGPPLAATDVTVLAPLPGRSASVAYLRLQNNSRRPIVVSVVSSPQFGRVEIHETEFVDGIAHMRALDHVTIAPQSSVSFEEGGKHLMLSEARKALLPGDDVRLQVHYDDGGLLLLDARLQTRLVK